MKFRPHQINKTTTLLAWLFVGAMVSQGPSPNYVLCIGTDGHIEVEAATRGQCISFATDVQQKTSGFPACAVLAVQDHCGRCLDLPIFISNCDREYVLPQRDVSQYHALVIVLTLSIPRDFTSAPPDFFSINSQPHDCTLASLDTITLLI